MYVILPGVFGTRMCFHCLDCNGDSTDIGYMNKDCNACCDYMGHNHRAMGGYAGLATGMAFATEYQGEGTPHGHGFISLANMYQHHNLEEIGKMIAHISQKITAADMLERITQFVEHVQREDHFEADKHESNIGQPESEFHANNAGPLKKRALEHAPCFLVHCSGISLYVAWFSKLSPKNTPQRQR